MVQSPVCLLKGNTMLPLGRTVQISSYDSFLASESRSLIVAPGYVPGLIFFHLPSEIGLRQDALHEPRIQHRTIIIKSDRIGSLLAMRAACVCVAQAWSDRQEEKLGELVNAEPPRGETLTMCRPSVYYSIHAL